MQRLFYDVETLDAVYPVETMCLLFYNVETFDTVYSMEIFYAAYSVETFDAVYDAETLGAKSFLLDLNSFHGR